MVFSKEWFLKYQKLLLIFANSWVGRKVLCLKTSDVKENKIIQILPNSITWKGKKRRQYVTEFRTHDKFGKRLFYAFKPVWYLLHLWDMVWHPKFNLGFDTLTAYPDAHTETTTVDGRVDRRWDQAAVNDSWTNIRIGAGTGANSSGTTMALDMTGGDTSNNWWGLTRTITLFNTASLTENAIISAATLSLYGTAKTNAIGNSPVMDIVSSNPASNTDVVSGDYDYNDFGTTVYSNIAYASFSTSGYNAFVLDSNGIATISKTGVSKFGQRFHLDVTGGAPTWGDKLTDSLTYSTADETGTTQDPKLVVTYTTPAILDLTSKLW